jgi:hypothetical protein
MNPVPRPPCSGVLLHVRTSLTWAHRLHLLWKPNHLSYFPQLMLVISFSCSETEPYVIQPLFFPQSPGLSKCYVYFLNHSPATNDSQWLLWSALKPVCPRQFVSIPSVLALILILVVPSFSPGSCLTNYQDYSPTTWGLIFMLEWLHLSPTDCIPHLATHLYRGCLPV